MNKRFANITFHLMEWMWFHRNSSTDNSGVNHVKCKWKLINAKSKVSQIIVLEKSSSLAWQHMRSVLRVAKSGGGSMTVAIAVVVVLSPGGTILLCWPDIQFETDSSIHM